MDKVYVIMWHNELFERRFYTDESVVEKRVEELNKGVSLGPYWYETLKIKN
jgi:hypothetical protein